MWMKMAKAKQRIAFKRAKAAGEEPPVFEAIEVDHEDRTELSRLIHSGYRQISGPDDTAEDCGCDETE